LHISSECRNLKQLTPTYTRSAHTARVPQKCFFTLSSGEGEAIPGW
jgi:hypothetical protein